jgi:hypothetical protein
MGVLAAAAEQLTGGDRARPRRRAARRGDGAHGKCRRHKRRRRRPYRQRQRTPKGHGWCWWVRAGHATELSRHVERARFAPADANREATIEHAAGGGRSYDLNADTDGNGVRFCARVRDRGGSIPVRGGVYRRPFALAHFSVFQFSHATTHPPSHPCARPPPLSVNTVSRMLSRVSFPWLLRTALARRCFADRSRSATRSCRTLGHRTGSAPGTGVLLSPVPCRLALVGGRMRGVGPFSRRPTTRSYPADLVAYGHCPLLPAPAPHRRASPHRMRTRHGWPASPPTRALRRCGRPAARRSAT